MTYEDCPRFVTVQCTIRISCNEIEQNNVMYLLLQIFEEYKGKTEIIWKVGEMADMSKMNTRELVTNEKTIQFNDAVRKVRSNQYE